MVLFVCTSSLSPWWWLEHAVETSAKLFFFRAHQIIFPSFVFFTLQTQAFVMVFIMQLCRSGVKWWQYYGMLTACVVVSVWVGKPRWCMQEDTQSYQCHHGAIASHTNFFQTFLPTLDWSKNPRFKANEQCLQYKKLITTEKSAVSNTTLVQVKKM